MAAFLLALVLAAQPAEISVDQLDQAHPARPAAPIEQLSTGENSAYVEDEPADRARLRDDVAQLSTADNLVVLGKVDGIDLCSAELLSADERAFCDRRIEMRSAEFRMEGSAPLSAEQKLLGERLPAMRGAGIEAATRSATSGVSADDRDFQALAAITLKEPPPASDNKTGSPSDVSAETQALIEAIVSKFSNPQGN